MSRLHRFLWFSLGTVMLALSSAPEARPAQALPLLPPADFTGSAVSETEILWSWSPVHGSSTQLGASFYELRTDPGGTLIAVVDPSPDSPVSFSETGLEPGVEYCRYIVAHGEGQTARTGTICITTLETRECKVVALNHQNGKSTFSRPSDPKKPLTLRWRAETKGKGTFVIRVSKKDSKSKPKVRLAVSSGAGTTKGKTEVEVTTAAENETLEIELTVPKQVKAGCYLVHARCKDEGGSGGLEDEFCLIDRDCTIEVKGPRGVCGGESGDFTTTVKVPGKKIKSVDILWIVSGGKIKAKGAAGNGADQFADPKPTIKGDTATSDATITVPADAKKGGLTVQASGVTQDNKSFFCEFKDLNYIEVVSVTLEGPRALCLGDGLSTYTARVSMGTGFRTQPGTKVIWEVTGNLLLEGGKKEVEIPLAGGVSVAKIRPAPGVTTEERGPDSKLTSRIKVRVVGAFKIDGEVHAVDCGLKDCGVILLKKRTVTLVLHVGKTGTADATGHGAAVRDPNFLAAVGGGRLGLNTTFKQACISFTITRGADGAFNRTLDFNTKGEFKAGRAGATPPQNANNAIDVHFVGGSQIDSGDQGITSFPPSGGGNWDARSYMSDGFFNADGSIGSANVLSHELGHALAGLQHGAPFGDCFEANVGSAGLMSKPISNSDQPVILPDAIEKIVSNLDSVTLK